MIAPLLGIQLGKQQREFDILERSEYGNQVEGLKHVSDMHVAPVGGLRIAKAEHVLAQYQQLS